MEGFPETTEAFALQKDQQDNLSHFRSQFHFPRFEDREAIYFCGNSLGLQPKNAEGAILQELADWRNFAIGGFRSAKTPWLYYQDYFSKPLSRIVGALENEVTVMNTLTVNLHLLMLSFYKPTSKRYKIMMEAGAFPSDQYAVESQVTFHGFLPEEAIIEIGPREGEKIIREEDILQAIDMHSQSLALVIWGGINYYSGQYFDMKTITHAAHRVGAIVGFDLAHVAGNLPLQLHNWDIDFAAWCSYKYLNGGPGAVGGVFIHERLATHKEQHRMAGWWGNDEKTRFRMEKGFVPRPGAGGWNISTAQVMNMACLKASLEIFDQTDMESLRKKSIDLTAYLASLLNQLTNLPFEILSPTQTDRRGAQLSLYFKDKGKEIFDRMTAAGIVVDYREPGVIRVAPTPLYNSFQDVFLFYEILKKI